MTIFEKIWGTAGTGKTSELIKRIKEARYDRNYPNGLLVKDMTICTFRKNAADDMIEKLIRDGLIKQASDAPFVSTLHGVALRTMNLKKGQVMTGADTKRFCESAKLKPVSMNLEFNESETSIEGKAGDFFKMYAWMNNTLTPLNQCHNYPNLMLSEMNKSMFIRLYHKYDEYKKDLKKVDFCDMLNHVIETGNVPIGSKLLIVDEFQDLTPQQYEVFRIMADSADKVIVAGDPLQTIYGYQGATPDYYIDMDADQITLPTTYRLPARVWELAKRIVSPRGMEVPEISTVRGAGIFEYVNQNMAAKLCYDYPTNTMHLLRTNYQAQALSYVLAEAGIVFAGINGWSRKDVDLTNSIIKLRSKTPITTSEAIELISSMPQTALNAKKETIKKSLISSKKLKHSIHDVKAHTGLTGYDVIEDVLKSTAPTTKMHDLSNLRSKKVAGALKRHVAPIELNLDTVKLYTIHGSKGLEADTVFLHSGITGKISASMINKKHAAEEARVFFVGATRTKQNLYVVQDNQSNYKIPKVVA